MWRFLSLWALPVALAVTSEVPVAALRWAALDAVERQRVVLQHPLWETMHAALAAETSGPGIPWADMNRTQRLARLRSLVDAGLQGAGLATREGISVLSPVLGEHYAAALGEELGALPRVLLDSMPAQYAYTRGCLVDLGLRGEVLDRVVDRSADMIFGTLEDLSQPGVITRSLLPPYAMPRRHERR
jgi:hypothetical protein